MENSNKNSELKKQNEELVKIAIQLGKIADLLSLSSRLDKVGN